MINILCLYWVGKFRGRDFGVDDIYRLRQSVDKHIDRKYKFYCLTNDMETDFDGIEKIELENDFPGWWSKIEIHRPDLPPDRTLYLDLDSHVIRNLKPILDYDGDLVMFPSKASLQSKWSHGVVHKYQAAVMLFTPGVTSWFYKQFIDNADEYMRSFRSEQDMMGKFMPNQPTFPSEWLAKLSACVHKGEAPRKAIIVTGQPAAGWFRKTDQIPWLERMARG